MENVRLLSVPLSLYQSHLLHSSAVSYTHLEGNTLVLRPDITPSIARSAAKYFMDEDMPIRLSYTVSYTHLRRFLIKQPMLPIISVWVQFSIRTAVLRILKKF